VTSQLKIQRHRNFAAEPLTKKRTRYDFSLVADYYENGLLYNDVWYHPLEKGYHGRFVEPGIIQGLCFSRFLCCLGWPGFFNYWQGCLLSAWGVLE